MKRHRKRKQVDPWEVRKASLRALDFADYQAYLASDLWRKIRAKVYATKGKGCSFCDGAATQVHHNDYKSNTMRGKNINGLLPVCGDCHKRGSKSSAGWILRPRSATQKMRQLQAPPGQVKHAFESRGGSALCGFCDRPERDHAGPGRQPRTRRKRSRRVVSPEEKQRRKAVKAARKVRRLAARRLRPRGSKKNQAKAKQIAEGQAILDAIDARGKETARKHRARVLKWKRQP